MSDSAYPSKSFQRFLDAFLGTWTYEMWHEGVDVQSLSGLSAQEQHLAEDLLLEHLEQGRTDSRIFVGLGKLCSQRAVPALSTYLQSWRGERSVIEPAVALWQIARAPLAVTALIEVLAGHSDFFGRMDAAIALGDCRCEQAAQALEQALSDEHYLVRSHATTSLLVICSLLPHRKRRHPLTIKIMSDGPKVREAALRRILVSVKRRSLPSCEEVNGAR